METKTSLEPLSINNKTGSILLIDNEALDLFINQKLLENYGFSEIVVYKSAREALDFLKETDVTFGFIIVDMSMPFMNGFEFIDAFIEQGYHKIHGEICLLTASINPSDKEKAMSANIRFMEKPLTMDKLFPG